MSPSPATASCWVRFGFGEDSGRTDADDDDDDDGLTGKQLAGLLRLRMEWRAVESTGIEIAGACSLMRGSFLFAVPEQGTAVPDIDQIPKWVPSPPFSSLQRDDPKWCSFM